MPSINFIEKIVISFTEGKYHEVIAALNEESLRLKKAGLMGASKRLESVSKKIPLHTKSFSAASANNNTKIIDLTSNTQTGLVRKYRPEVSPEEVILNSAVKAKITNLFREWEDYERLSKHNLFPTNRILFYGPPGTGKTLLANAIAHQLDFPLVLVRLDELISSFLGETGKNIRSIFEMASHEPVVLFLDEVDTIAKFRSDEKELGELKRVVTVLLQHIDFFPQKSIIIAATNHDEMLDKAIWRRFPLKIMLDLPDEESRKLLFKLYLTGTDYEINFDLVSTITAGLNGSEIFDIVQNSKKQSVLTHCDKITNAIIAKSYLTIANSEKLNKNPSRQTIYLLCQHLKEAGFKFREIESISGIPYTTLKDNLK